VGFGTIASCSRSPCGSKEGCINTEQRREGGERGRNKEIARRKWTGKTEEHEKKEEDKTRNMIKGDGEEGDKGEVKDM
jgi:hypothetical protein